MNDGGSLAVDAMERRGIGREAGAIVGGPHIERLPILPCWIHVAPNKNAGGPGLLQRTAGPITDS